MKNEDQTSLDTVLMCLRGNMATFRIQYLITRKCDEILFQVCKLRLLPLMTTKIKNHPQYVNRYTKRDEYYNSGCF
jgi:hypothetical protein